MYVLARISSASVLLGQTPVRKPAALTAWSPTWLPGCDRVRFVTIASELLKGSSGFKIGVNSKPVPTVAGVNCCMMAPFGKYTTPNRRGASPAAFTTGVNAGTIDSRNGRLIAPPITLSIVRRDSDFLVTNIREYLAFLVWSFSHLKRHTASNAEDNA